MPDETKFCKDCRFCKVSSISRFFGWWTYAKCTHTNAFKINKRLEMLVSGKPSAGSYYFCVSQRFSGCGPEARDFEPKESK